MKTIETLSASCIVIGLFPCLLGFTLSVGCSGVPDDDFGNQEANAPTALQPPVTPTPVTPPPVMQPPVTPPPVTPPPAVMQPPVTPPPVTPPPVMQPPGTPPPVTPPPVMQPPVTLPPAMQPPGTSGSKTTDTELELVHTLDVTIRTGGDDLRDDDHASITMLFADRQDIETSINGSERFADNSTHELSVDIPGGVELDSIIGFQVCGTMSGGLGGDNWNIDSLQIEARIKGTPLLFSDSGTPLVRLTGDQPCTRVFHLSL